MLVFFVDLFQLQTFIELVLLWYFVFFSVTVEVLYLDYVLHSNFFLLI